MAFDFPSTPAVNDRYDTGEGVVYRWDGLVWLVDTGLTPLPNNQRVVVYSGVGSYSYVKPAGLKYLQVELFGAGGGGGGAGITAAGQMSGGGGGAAGGYARKLYRTDELATSEPLVLGAGGTGGVGAASGLSGTTSTFKAMTANAGSGGGFMSPNVTIGTAASRGIVGTSAGGDMNGGGGSGYPATRFAHGSSNLFLVGQGGQPYMARDHVPQQASASIDNSAAGASAGGGGHGSFNVPSSAGALTGGAGGDAFAVFTEYFWDPDYVSVAPLISQVKVVQYPLAGSFSYVKPAGLKYVQVEIWGSGGGSGGASVTVAGQVSAGGGGGGGGYVRKLYAAGDLASSEPMVIGVGGAGGNATTPTNGLAGSNSTFKAMTIQGGGGGATGAGINTMSTVSRGTAGVGSGGDVNGSGNSGQYGYRNFPINGWGIQGYGGAGYGQAQFFATHANSNQTSADVAAGINSGANGAFRIASQAAENGFKGGDGFALFTEYY